MPHIARLVRYPVKGFPGQEIRRAHVRPGAGLPFDRALAFMSGHRRPPGEGQWAPTRTFHTLTSNEDPLRSSVEVDEVAGAVQLRHPDHGTLTVPLDTAGPVDPLDGRAGDWFAEPTVVHRAADGYWDDPDGGISIVNLNSVTALARVGGVTIDPLRFRANLYLDGLRAWEELALIGRRLRIGDVDMDILHPINRCGATCVNPANGARDLNVPALLATHLGHVYCGLRARVVTGGTLAQGDRLFRTARRVRPRRADSGPQPSGWPRYARIVRRVRHGPDTISLWLADPIGDLRPESGAGQHIVVHADDGAGPVWRAYTVSASRGSRLLRITVRRVGRMSTLLHERAVPGSRLLISGPHGGTVLDGNASRPLLLVSAGIGITQTLALLRACAKRHPDRPLILHHTARHDTDLALWDEATALVGEMPHAQARLFLTGETGETARRLGATAGRPDLAHLPYPGPGTVAYLCGPTAFMDTAERSLIAAEVHREVFASPGRTVPEPSRSPSLGPFRVEFTASGVTAHWRPEDGTLLDLAESVGAQVKAGCRAGACRMCSHPMTSGEVAHTLPPALPPAHGSALLCCTVPVTDMTIDA